MTDKINILYLIDHLEELGGTERHLVYLTTRLAERGYDVAVVAFHLVENEMPEQMRAAGVDVVFIPVARYYTFNAIVQAWRIYRLIKRKKINLVQTYHYKADTYGAMVSRLAGVRCLISSKRDAAEFKSGFKFFVHRLVQPITKKYIVVSDQITQMIQIKERVPQHKIIKLHNGVDAKRYSVATEAQRHAAKIALGIPAESVVIGQVAWFREEKDHESLFLAFEKVINAVPQAYLVLLGGGPLMDHYKARARDLNIDQRILFAGVISDVGPYLDAMNIGCLVPKSNEGFSNAIIEKMAKGLPLVVTDVGGNREAVTDGDNGFVVRPGDAEEIAKKLTLLARDEELRASMGRASRKRAIEDFDLAVMVERHDALYRSLIGRH